MAVRRKKGSDPVEALATAGTGDAEAFLASQSSRLKGRRVSAAKFLSVKSKGPGMRFGHKIR